MKWSAAVVPLAALPGAWAWGGFGHITVAYVATNFVSSDTAAYLQNVLQNDTSDYLAGIATWADSIRYTKWGRFTEPFHFIDAKDSPPSSCSVDLERDCKKVGCVVTALANYTTRLLDTTLTDRDRQDAAKFVVHFVGDIHQPLHDEDIKRGGNGIKVTFDGQVTNLHHVWDTNIPEKLVGGVSRSPFREAAAWAQQLTDDINGGRFSQVAKQEWLSGINLADPVATALVWATEGNTYVCSTVLPSGEDGVTDGDLGSDYYEAAVPVVEIQIARAGYRLAAWLNLIASAANQSPSSGEL